MTEEPDILISYPSTLSAYRRDHQLDTPRFRAYLRRILTDSEDGDTLHEFVGGGCGSTADVTLTIESINVDTVTDDTTIQFVER